MQIFDFYVYTDGNNTIPFFQDMQLTPFGQKIGYAQQNFTNFQAGVPDASHFENIQNLDNCPMSKQCQQQDGQYKFKDLFLHKIDLIDYATQAMKKVTIEQEE